MREVRERNIDELLLVCTPPKDRTCNPGMCLTGNQTSDLSLSGTTPNQLSPTREARFSLVWADGGFCNTDKP